MLTPHVGLNVLPAQNKTALITGSTSGIGLGIAEKLASEGANIILNGFGEAQAIAKQRHELAEKYGVQVRYQGADLSKPTEIEQMMQAVLAEFGCVDILVNNAGIQYVAPIE